MVKHVVCTMSNLAFTLSEKLFGVTNLVVSKLDMKIVEIRDLASDLSARLFG